MHIHAIINRLRYLAVILSPNSINSEWVNKELDMAMNEEINGKKLKVLPLLYRKCDIPGFLRGKLYADFTTEKKFDESFSKLLDTLGVDKNDNRRVTGQYCILEKDFKKTIKNYFASQSVIVKYYEDLSGIDYIKVDLGNDMFTLYSFWTKPTHIEVLNNIFKQDSKELISIEIMDDLIYLDKEKDDFFSNLLEKFSLPKDSYPGQWEELNENGLEAYNEWHNWLEERRPISLIYK